MSRARLVVTTLAALAVLGSAVVLVFSAVSTSSARVAATTSGDSFFAAGEVQLSQPDSRVDLLFDDDGLFPGRAVTGCVLVRYDGTVPTSVRLHGQRTSGTGLDDYVDLTIGLADDCETDETADGAGANLIFDGRLSGLWASHGAYARGLVLVPSARPGDLVAIHATAQIADDNRAQGLTTTFTLTVEARP